MLLTAGDTTVLRGDFLDREDSVAGGVLLEGAEVAIQHDGVRLSGHADTGNLGIGLGLITEEGT